MQGDASVGYHFPGPAPGTVDIYDLGGRHGQEEDIRGIEDEEEGKGLQSRGVSLHAVVMRSGSVVPHLFQMPVQGEHEQDDGQQKQEERSAAHQQCVTAIIILIEHPCSIIECAVFTVDYLIGNCISSDCGDG